MFKILETLPKFIAWLQIAIAPLIVGGVAGFFIYAYHPTRVCLAIAILASVIGLVLGIQWANRVERKRGVVEHMSRAIATPELDQNNEDSSQQHITQV
jgi:hypothetical protein